jgi:hypothetical protein
MLANIDLDRPYWSSSNLSSHSPRARRLLHKPARQPFFIVTARLRTSFLVRVMIPTEYRPAVCAVRPVKIPVRSPAPESSFGSQVLTGCQSHSAPVRSTCPNGGPKRPPSGLLIGLLADAATVCARSPLNVTLPLRDGVARRKRPCGDKRRGGCPNPISRRQRATRFLTAATPQQPFRVCRNSRSLRSQPS